jgi:hypothetical protein
MPAPVTPTLGAISFSCPHCGAFAHQHWFHLSPDQVPHDATPFVATFAELPPEVIAQLREEDQASEERGAFLERLKKNDVTYENFGYKKGSNWEFVNLHASLCSSCGGWAIWVKDNFVYPVVNSEIAPHEDMPHAVRADFEEAASIVDRSPRGAAALLRLCVQKLMPIFGQPGKNINDDIGALVKNGLEVGVQRALDIVRVTGNNAVHPGQFDLQDSPEVAHRLFTLVNLIVERMITTPRQLEEMLKALPEGAQRAIEKRDGAVKEEG